MSAPGWSKVTQDEAAEMYAEVRAEVLREAADTQWTYAREHWRPADGDSHSAVAKKERKFGAAERLICLIDPNPPVLLPRAVRVLPHEDGFVVRWQVGEEARSTWRATRAGADAAADDLRRMAAAGQAGKDSRKAESTRANAPQVWYVFEEDSPVTGLPTLYAAQEDARRGTIDRYKVMEGVCPDYSWLPHEDGAWELLAGGEPVGIYLAPVPVARASDAEAEPDFFRPGRTYQRRRWLFQCLATAPNPFNGETRAVGFLYRPGEPATATALDPDDWEQGGWTEVTEAPADRVQESADKLRHLGGGGQPDEDEWVRCSHLHCPNSERYARATERGWTHHHMDTWRCPQHPIVQTGGDAR